MTKKTKEKYFRESKQYALNGGTESEYWALRMADMIKMTNLTPAAQMSELIGYLLFFQEKFYESFCDKSVFGDIIENTQDAPSEFVEVAHENLFDLI